MLRRILIPIDGSANSYRGLEYAADLAKKYGAEVTLIHVIEQHVVAESFGPPRSLPESYYHESEEYARKLTTERKEQLEGQGIKVETVIANGNPVVEILRAAKGFDLIVIGSRGLGRFEKLLLGSVSSGILQHSHVPVLVVR